LPKRQKMYTSRFRSTELFTGGSRIRMQTIAWASTSCRVLFPGCGCWCWWLRWC